MSALALHHLRNTGRYLLRPLWEVWTGPEPDLGNLAGYVWQPPGHGWGWEDAYGRHSTATYRTRAGAVVALLAIASRTDLPTTDESPASYGFRP